jgi:hypothetical protein
VFAELKTKKGRIQPSQKEWLGDLERCEGVEVYVWRPDDLEEILACLA